jgi:hypothetical protein
MKINIVAPFALISLCVAACEQKSAQVTSTSSPSSSRPSESAEVSDFSGVSTSSVAEASVPEEAAPAPSPSTAATAARPVFKSEAATQAANQYLDSYASLLNDLNATPHPPAGNPEAMMSYLRTYTQKLARDSADLTNRQRQADSQLNPEERKRLRQYQKSLEQAGQE